MSDKCRVPVSSNEGGWFTTRRHVSETTTTTTTQSKWRPSRAKMTVLPQEATALDSKWTPGVVESFKRSDARLWGSITSREENWRQIQPSPTHNCDLTATLSLRTPKPQGLYNHIELHIVRTKSKRHARFYGIIPPRKHFDQQWVTRQNTQDTQDTQDKDTDTPDIVHNHDDNDRS